MFDSMLCASMSTLHCQTGKVRISSPGRIIPEAVMDNIALRNGNVIVSIKDDADVLEVNLSKGTNIYPASTDFAYIGNFIHAGKATGLNKAPMYFADVIMALVGKAQPVQKSHIIDDFFPSLYMVREGLTLDGENILKPFDLVSVEENGRVSQFNNFEALASTLEKYIGTPSKSLVYSLQSMCKTSLCSEEVDEEIALHNIHSGRISKFLFQEAINIAICRGIAGVFWLAASTAFSQEAVDTFNVSHIA